MELTQEAIKALEGVAQQSTLESFLGQLPRGGSGGGSGASSASANFEKLGDVVGDTGGALLGFASTVFSSGARVSDGFKALDKITGSAAANFGGALGGVATGMNAVSREALHLVKAAEAGVDSFRSLSTSGASFNNNILELKNSAAQSRLTLDEFAGIVQNNSAGFAAFGGTVTKGAKLFTDASKNMFDNGLANPLLNMGMTFEEVNEGLAEYMVMNRRRFTEEQIRNGVAAQSMAAMAKEMDKVAKLTGQNRKEMEKEIQDRMRKGQVEARIRQLELSGNQEAADKMRLALAEASKAGPGALAAVEDLFTKGAVVSEEGRAAAVALGPAFDDLQNMVNYASGPGGIEGMGASISNFNAAVSERVNDPNFLNIARLGGMGNQFADAAAGMITTAGTYADNVNALMASENVSREEAIRRLEERAVAEQGARDAVTETVIEGERALRDLGAVINDTLIGPNGSFTKLAENLAPLADSLGDLRTRDYAGTVRDAQNFVDNLLGQGAAPESQRDPSVEAITQSQSDLITAVNNAIMNTEGGNEAAKKGLMSAMGNFGGQLAADIARVIENSANAKGITIEEQVRQMTDGVRALGQPISDLQQIIDLAQRAGENRGLDPQTIAEAVSAGAMSNMPLEELGRITQMTVDQLVVTGGIEPRALGGPVFANSPYLVGEQGPELFVPKTDGQIRTSSETASISAALNNVQASASGVTNIDTANLERAIASLGTRLEQVFTNSSSQSGNAEMQEMLNNSLQQLTSTASKQFDVARKQLRAQRGAIGNVFKGL